MPMSYYLNYFYQMIKIIQCPHLPLHFQLIIILYLALQSGENDIPIENKILS